MVQRRSTGCPAGSTPIVGVFDLLRELCDVVIVGAGTVRGEGYGPMVLPPPSVDQRASGEAAAHPVFAIVSNRLDLDPSSRIFTEAPVRPIVVTTGIPPAIAGTLSPPWPIS
jgi:riboflavin biosynthesis pyrimidine reductase